MTALADDGDFTWILLKSCVTLNEYMPKTKDQKGKKKCWLNARKTHKSQNWAAFQVTSDELTLFSFPLNCRFRKLTCLYKSVQSEGWEVVACTQGRLPLLTCMWYELALAKKRSAVWEICDWKTDGWTDGRAGGGVSALRALSSPDRPRVGGNGARRKVSYISYSWNNAQHGWNVQQPNKQPGRHYWGITLLKTDYLPSGNGKRAFWPLGEERLIENALRRAGARSAH